MAKKNVTWTRSLLSNLVFAALCIVVCTGCQTLKSNRQAIKPTEAEKQFDYRQIELDNGLKVITLEDFSCPIVAAQVWYHVGSKNEDPQRQGFAHMFEHMMFKGTDRVEPKDHFDFINRVGGTNNAYTSFDQTVYIQTLPAEELALALWLEAERMNFLKIDQEAFDTERKVVEEELRMGENRPYGTFYKKMLAEMYKVHPYRWSVIGSISNLRAASVPELRDFWKRFYVPSNATLVIVGAVSHEKAQELAKKYFGWIPRFDQPQRVTVREPLQTEANTVVIDNENAPAAMLITNWHTVTAGHKDEYALELLAEILGGGNSSRLYRELVAEKQLAVEAGASMSTLEHDGIFSVDIVQAPQSDADKILPIVKKHIEKVITDGVTNAELEKARNQKLRSLVTRNLTIQSKARMLGDAAVIEGDVSRVNKILDMVKAVTKEDLQRAAGQYLAENRSTTFIVKQNTKGMQAGQKDIEDTPVTAQREEKAPQPGREGAARPKDFPVSAPFVKKSAGIPTPKYFQTKLPNGLKVIAVPNHEVPFVSVQLGLLNGAWTQDKAGSASMAMDMLTKGTAKYTEAELAEELERYAISLGGSAQMDTCSIGGGCLSEQAERMMGLMAQVVLEPTFPQDEFEKLRQQVLTGLAVQQETPRYLVGKLLREKLYGSHPYSKSVEGEISDVEALSAADAKTWWDNFARPDKAVLIFSGDIDKAKAVELAEKNLGAWRPKTAAAQPKLPTLTPPKSLHIYLLDKPGSVQSEIRIAQLGITRHAQPDYFVSRVVNQYFGGSFNSRLNDVIRVRKGLTYGARGGYQTGKFGGSFEMSTFTKNASTAEAVQVMLDEVRRLQKTGPDKTELGDSISYITGSFARDRETPQQVAGDFWLLESDGLKADFFNRLLDRVSKTSGRDCLELAGKTLNPDKMVIAIVGDAEKIKADLEKIAPVTVIKE